LRHFLEGVGGRGRTWVHQGVIYIRQMAAWSKYYFTPGCRNVIYDAKLNLALY